MRNCGRHIVLLALASSVLAACGGGEASQSSSGGAGNLPPIIEGSPVTTLAAGASYSFTPQAADPDGDKLTFSATGIPGWASFDSATGKLWGTPTEANVGMTGMITIAVSDSKSESDLPAFRIQVTSTATAPAGVNNPPTIAGTPPTSAAVGKPYTFVPTGDDADDDTLSFTIDNKPSWITFTPATGQMTGTPTSSDVGTTNGIVIHVSDGQASADLPAFNLQVIATAPANRPPTITGTPATTVTAGAAYSFRPVASDPDGNTLRYSIQGQPTWATFSTSTGRLNGTPTSANLGTSARITITVTDGTLSVSLPSFTIQVVAAANRAPTISGNPVKSVLVGVAYLFQPSATDADGNALTFRIENKPTWAVFSASTGRLSGTPAAGDVGSTANILISVSDGTASASLAAFTLAVVQSANGSATVSWTAPTTNTDGTVLTNLTGFRVAYGQNANNLDQSASVGPGVATYTISNLTSGDWFFGVFAVNSSGGESSVSNIASKTIQ
jgi:Putative Ig domain